jgi:hypothetical protein
MEGFVSVFDQALLRSELVEAIGYLRELDLGEIAGLFEQALALLDINHFYAQDGKPVTGCSGLSQQYRDELAAIGQRITQEDVLWDIDEKLADMLSMDSPTQH